MSHGGPLNWKTRLEVTVDGKAISAIDSFTPTFNTQTTPIHSIEADNIGAVIHPADRDVHDDAEGDRADRGRVDQVRASKGRNSISQVAEKKGTDWTFNKMLFRDCLITSANPSNVVIDGAPGGDIQRHHSRLHRGL